MKTTILYLYGPPAVGKTTVARKLARNTGWPVLHPHLFSPIASALMRGDVRTNQGFRKLVTKLRMTAIRSGLRAGLPGIILTGVYVSEPKKNYFINWLANLPIRVLFIQLTASEKTLMKRVGATSRRVSDNHKITSRKLLAERMAKADLVSPIHPRNNISSITFSTEKVSAAEIAKNIMRKLGIHGVRK